MRKSCTNFWRILLSLLHFYSFSYSASRHSGDSGSAWQAGSGHRKTKWRGTCQKIWIRRRLLQRYLTFCLTLPTPTSPSLPLISLLFITHHFDTSLSKVFGEPRITISKLYLSRKFSREEGFWIMLR